jgi:hypothetical protein
MKSIITFRSLVLAMACFAGITSCKKSFLDTIPNKSLLVPTTLSDFQAILDNTSVMNLSPEISLMASDDFYTTSDGLLGLSTQTEKNSYFWAQNVYQGESVQDWNTPYQQIFYCNVILDGLKSLQYPDQASYNAIKGGALFYRGLAGFNLSQVFAASYDPANAGQLLGIPLRTSSDINIKAGRGTLQQTYNQLVSDLQAALKLLPLQTIYKSRPNKAAGYGLLARVYLSMAQYDKAGAYADSSLQLNSKLNNYAGYDPTAYRPFPLALPDNNDEIDFNTSLLPYSFDESGLTFVDTTLSASYSSNDLRRSLYFYYSGPGQYNFQGSYSGTYFLDNSVTTDEMYLIRAESNARAGYTSTALGDLNKLLVTRYAAGTYQPYTAADKVSALDEILMERRKELVGRGLRWSDLRRLNKESRYAIALTRNIGGQVYTLPPNDPRYVFPIPDDEIRESGIEQNQR